MTTEAQQARGTAASWSDATDKLEILAAVLAARGLAARLVTPPGRVPSLHVRNPAAATQAEDVYAGTGKDGVCWFWWPWAERIAASDDLAAAASVIERVLTANV